MSVGAPAVGEAGDDDGRAGACASLTPAGAFDGGVADASHPASTVAPDTTAYDFQVIRNPSSF
jgi:hypothetical protein